MPTPTLDDLRRYAVARTLGPPTTLARAIARLGFVQADPIRAPARAQDLTLRHRVAGYLAGDLERRYTRLDVHEDFFVNYGFLSGPHWALMHPRRQFEPWDAATRRRARAVLAFVAERGRAHPREVDAHFAHGSVTNYWGGSSNATTHLLDGMHYRGWLRVVRRDNGIRVYAPHAHVPQARHPAARRARVDALVDVIVRKYAPLPATTLSTLIRRLRYAVPQHREDLGAAIERAKARLAHARIDGRDWYWPADEDPRSADLEAHDAVRLLAPFDPIAWDRLRFELLWGWAYRFEAYTPAPMRKLGYYALPLIWRDRATGWANLAVERGRLRATFGHVDRPPANDPLFKRAVEAELDDLRRFLAL